MGTISNNSSGAQYNPRGVTQGNTLVDPNTGLPITVIEETDGSRRLAVDANLSADEIVVDTRDLNYTTDNVAIKGATGNQLIVNPDGSINVDTLISAAAGDNIAISNGVNELDINSDGSIKTVGLFNLPYDTVSATYPTTTQEIYTSYLGGLSGTQQQVVTVNYTDNTKDYITTVLRTPVS